MKGGHPGRGSEPGSLAACRPGNPGGDGECESGSRRHLLQTGCSKPRYVSSSLTRAGATRPQESIVGVEHPGWRSMPSAPDPVKRSLVHISRRRGRGAQRLRSGVPMPRCRQASVQVRRQIASSQGSSFCGISLYVETLLSPIGRLLAPTSIPAGLQDRIDTCVFGKLA
jgi:hypothetical protein